MYPIPIQACINPNEIHMKNTNPLVYKERVFEKPCAMYSPLAPNVEPFDNSDIGIPCYNKRCKVTKNNPYRWIAYMICIFITILTLILSAFIN